jgi:biopolymer transport protein ExbB/TolQ
VKLCGLKSKSSLKRIGLLLFLLLLVSLPSYSIEIEDQDWEVVSNFVLTSETELPKLSNQLQIVNQKLSQSEQTLTSLQEKQKLLETSLENTRQEVEKLTKSNSRLKIVTSVGLTIGIVGLVTGVILIFR